MLRAARQRLEQLSQEFDVRPTAALEQEITCLTAGISWLWLQPAVDEGR
jgi:hypothetical protein